MLRHQETAQTSRLVRCFIFCSPSISCLFPDNISNNNFLPLFFQYLSSFLPLSWQCLKYFLEQSLFWQYFSDILSNLFIQCFPHQFLASFLAMLPGFTFGSLLTYAAVAVPQVLVTLSLIHHRRHHHYHCLFIVHCLQIFLFQLTNPNSTGILIDIYQASWIGEILLVICIPNQYSVLISFHVKSFVDLSL